MVSTKAINTRKVAILTGTTASGKTDLAIRYAKNHGEIEIINADSVLVYQGMDIGSAKPTQEEKSDVPHHLIDIQEPSSYYTAARFVERARAAIKDIHQRKKSALIVGGSGFYLKALINGLWSPGSADAKVRKKYEAMSSEKLFNNLTPKDPEWAEKIGPNDHYRLARAMEILEITGEKPSEYHARVKKIESSDSEFVVWVVDREKSELESRFNQRAMGMIKSGLVEETEKLIKKYPNCPALRAVGYAQVVKHLEGISPQGRELRPGLLGLQDEISLATRKLAKKQRTWFRGQKDASWFILDKDQEKLEQAFSEVYFSSDS